MKDILNLAYLRIIRKWKNSLLFFIVLLLSFSSASVSVSVVGSISNTNQQYKLNTYGKWYLAIPYGYDRDRELLTQRDWVEEFGTAKSLGTLSSSGKIIGIGTIDETLTDIGNIRLDAGTFPSADNEIAMEMDSLSALGYAYTLGQEITVTVMLPLDIAPWAEEDFLDILILQKNYTLCGIIHEYSDLWLLQYNMNNTVLNSAVISDTAADELLAEADSMLIEGQGVSLSAPVQQHFISVSEENRNIAEKDLSEYLYGYKDGTRDIYPCVNHLAYPVGSASEYDDFYMYIIALLTFISILCLEIIRLPSVTHSFSVLRSVGMSKGQLAFLQISETLILGIPAILLGIPFGAGLTWLVLRLMLYSGSVPIQVHIPFETLFFILGLWLAAIIISRLAVFVFTLRVPMIGRFQMNTSKSKGARLVRSGFIVLLLFVSSASVIFAGSNAVPNEYAREQWASYPSYDLFSLNDTPLSQTDLSYIREIPGISEAYGLSELFIGLSFGGLNEEDVYLSANEKYNNLPFGMVYLLVIDESYWTDALDFGSDITSFRNGEYVFVSVPDDGNEYPLPEEEAILHIYGYKDIQELFAASYTASYNPNAEYSNPNKRYLASYTVSARVMYIPENVTYRTLASMCTPYTVICSEQFFQNLLEILPAGEKWWNFTTGNKFGYDSIFAMADLNSDDLSTDIVIAKICNERGIWLHNKRQTYLAYVQERVQTLIMLYFSGACICIIALMILWSNVSLETKNEKHGFYIKRCIGMSKRQVDLNIFGKSLLRCLSAFLSGWIVYISWSTFEYIRIYKINDLHIDFVTGLKRVIESDMFYFKYYTGTYVIIFLIGLILPLALILYSKRELRKDGDLK